MNLFGLEITLGRQNGNGFIKRTECHRAQDAIRQHLDKCLSEIKDDLRDMKGDINTRFEDLKDFFIRRN